MDNTKPAWQSKTLWVNAIVAVAALVFPPAQAYIAAHPDMVLTVFAVLNMVLRVVTKGKVEIL